MIGRMVVAALLLLELGSVLVMSSGRLYIVQSNSMSPAIEAGDAVVVWPLGRAPAAGEIITFNASGGKTVTHRAVEVRDGMVVTRGDGNPAPDPQPTRLSDVRGQVVARLPYLGYFLVFLRQPGGWLLFVGLPVLLLLYSLAAQTRQQWREWRREQAATTEAPRRVI